MTCRILLLISCIFFMGCGGPKPVDTVLVLDVVPDRNFDEEAENKAIEQVKKLGGRCTQPKPGEAVNEITFKNAALKDDDLELLKSFPKLTGLTIQDCPGFTGTGLKHLVNTPKLTFLTLAGKELVASELVALAKTPKLRFLMLARLKLSADQFVPVAKLRELQTLELAEIPLTEAHLTPLAELQELMELFLKDTGLIPEEVKQFSDRVNAKRPKDKPRLGISF